MYPRTLCLVDTSINNGDLTVTVQNGLVTAIWAIIDLAVYLASVRCTSSDPRSIPDSCWPPFCFHFQEFWAVSIHYEFPTGWTVH